MTNEQGRYIRKMRNQAELSLREAAKLIGVSHVYLGEVERGVKGPFKREHWDRIANVIPGVSVQELRRTASSETLRIDIDSLSPDGKEAVFAFARRIEEDPDDAFIRQILNILDSKREHSDRKNDDP